MTDTDAERNVRIRVQHNQELRKHAAIIFYDWPNWDEHMEWMIAAPIDEIVDWAETIESQTE